RERSRATKPHSRDPELPKATAVFHPIAQPGRKRTGREQRSLPLRNTVASNPGAHRPRRCDRPAPLRAVLAKPSRRLDAHCARALLLVAHLARPLRRSRGLPTPLHRGAIAEPRARLATTTRRPSTRTSATNLGPLRRRANPSSSLGAQRFRQPRNSTPQ